MVIHPATASFRPVLSAKAVRLKRFMDAFELVALWKDHSISRSKNDRLVKACQKVDIGP
jgi:hypothetical protein